MAATSLACTRTQQPGRKGPAARTTRQYVCTAFNLRGFLYVAQRLQHSATAVAPTAVHVWHSQCCCCGQLLPLSRCGRPDNKPYCCHSLNPHPDCYCCCCQVQRPALLPCCHRCCHCCCRCCQRCCCLCSPATQASSICCRRCGA